MNQLSFQEIKSSQNLISTIRNSITRISNLYIREDGLIEVEYSQGNPVTNKNNSFTTLFQLDIEEGNQLKSKKVNNAPIRIQGNLRSRQHASTKRQLHVLDNAEKEEIFFEIYENEEIMETINVGKHHKTIMNNDSLGKNLVWNKAGTKIMYTAQMKPPTTKNAFEIGEEQDLKDFFKHSEYEQDLGESFKDIKQIGLFEYDLISKTLNQIEIADDILPTHIQYINDNQILLAGMVIPKEFKYGIYACNNRECNVLLSENELIRKPLRVDNKEYKNKDEQKNETQKNNLNSFKVVSKHFHSSYPVYLEKNDAILYSGHDYKVAHNNYMSINLVDLKTLEIQEIIPLEMENKSESGEFMGLFGYPSDILFQPVNDGAHILFTCVQAGAVTVSVLNFKDKSVKTISNFWNQGICSSFNQILDYDETRRIVYVLNFSYKQHYSVAAVLLSEDDYQPISFERCSILSDSNFLQKLLNSAFLSEKIYQSGEAQGLLYSIDKINDPELVKHLGIDVKCYEKQDRKMIVNVHGGPHGIAQFQITPFTLALLLKGYRVLCPNYTGSGGFGQNFIHKLFGKIGDIDANEIVDMVKKVANDNLINPNHVSVFGGSYGGFMGGIMATKFYEYFKCAVMLNPVVSMSFLPFISDIPEWGVAETLGQQLNWNIQEGEVKSLHHLSPMNNPVKIPIMLMIGGNDQRVPPQASFALRAQTIFNDQHVSTYYYPKAAHSLNDCPQTNFDVQVKSLLFLEAFTK